MSPSASLGTLPGVAAGTASRRISAEENARECRRRRPRSWTSSSPANETVASIPDCEDFIVHIHPVLPNLTYRRAMPKLARLLGT